MKSEFGPIDRIVSWIIHFSSGIPLGSEDVHKEQAQIKETDIGDVSQRSITGDLPRGGNVKSIRFGKQGEPKDERFIHRNCDEIYPTT